MRRLINKYRLVLVPLVLVLVCDLVLLVVNHVISAELEVASTNINISGRQRMLTQRIAKSVLLIDYRRRQGLDVSAQVSELHESIDLFGSTLLAFSRGGQAVSADGEVILMERVKQPDIEVILLKSDRIWRMLHRELADFIDGGAVISNKTPALIAKISESNLVLLGLMNEMTIALETGARVKTYILRIVQTLVVILILLFFFIATIRLLRRENYYDNLMENSTDIVIGVDIWSGMTTFVSGSIQPVLGYSQENFLGRPAAKIFHGESRQAFEAMLDSVKRLGRLDAERCEVRLIKRDGDILDADMVLQLTTSEDGRSLELSADIRDISERKAAEITLSQLAYRDELTGLPNRKLFLDLAAQTLSRASRNHGSFALMYIDLDGFKQVNDSHGHGVGDDLLVNLAGCLKSALRASDSVARIGGDEFAALIEDTESPEEVESLARKIISVLSRQRLIDGHVIRVGASIGVAMFPEHGKTIDELLENADTAMYRVKKEGKNDVAFFRPGSRAVSAR